MIEAVDTRPNVDNERVAIKFIERGPLVCADDGACVRDHLLVLHPGASPHVPR